MRLAVGNDQHLTRSCDVSRRERRKPPFGGADARVPRRPDRSERPLQRRLQASVESFDPARLEVNATDGGGFDREARVLEALQELLPFMLRGGWILLDERKIRAKRKRFSQPHPRLHAGSFGGRGDRPEQRLLPLRRPERSGPQRERRPLPQRRPQLESWDEKACDHYERMFYTNTCSVSRKTLKGQKIRRRRLRRRSVRGRADLAARPLIPASVVSEEEKKDQQTKEAAPAARPPPLSVSWVSLASPHAERFCPFPADWSKYRLEPGNL